MSREVIIVGGREFYQTGVSEISEIGFRITTLEHTDRVEAAKSDACLVTVQLGGRTPIFEIIDPEVVLTDQLIKGGGTLLRYNPRWAQGFIVETTSEGASPVFTYRLGTLFAWVAGANTSLEVFGTNTPPYNEGQERQLEVGDPHVPPTFRSTLLGLLHQTRPNPSISNLIPNDFSSNP